MGCRPVSSRSDVRKTGQNRSLRAVGFFAGCAGVSRAARFFGVSDRGRFGLWSGRPPSVPSFSKRISCCFLVVTVRPGSRGACERDPSRLRGGVLPVPAAEPQRRFGSERSSSRFPVCSGTGSAQRRNGSSGATVRARPSYGALFLPLWSRGLAALRFSLSSPVHGCPVSPFVSRRARGV